MATSPNLKLELMESNVLQPSVPFNAAMQILDVASQLTVQAFATAPPTTVAGDAGKVWIVQGGATGAFAGKDGQLALCTGANLWKYIVPNVGWRADLATVIYRWSGSAWNIVTAGGFYVPGFISGLQLGYVSAHVVSVGAGTCHVQSTDSNVRIDSATNVTIPSTASAWFHIYAAGNNLVEQSTTGPYVVPYAGEAMSKGGDTSRRYLGSVRTDSSGNVIPFVHISSKNLIKYSNNVISNLVLNAGTATTATSFDLSAFCPSTSRIASTLCYSSVASGGAFLFFSNSEAIAVSTSTYLAACTPQSYLSLDMLMSSDQKATYMFNASPGGGSGFVRVMGYEFSR